MIAINRKAEGHGSSHVTMDRVPPLDEIGTVRRILGDAFPADLRWTVDCLRSRGIAPSRTLLIAHGGPGIVPLVFAQELRFAPSVCAGMSDRLTPVGGGSAPNEDRPRRPADRPRVDWAGWCCRRCPL